MQGTGRRQGTGVTIMYKGQKVTVVMPAYNAEKTLRRSFEEVCEQDVADVVVIVDDCSNDGTEQVAREICNYQLPTTNYQLPTTIYHRHDRNMGYGGNQKSCYRLALDHGADIVVMVHPDCQYTPKLLVPMVAMIAEGLHPCVLASRILGGYALKGGMPWWKYVNNRWLTAVMNLLMGAKLSEYHTGYRAFSAELIRRLPLDRNDDDFAFDAQMLAEVLATDATIGEVSCPTVYTPEASSINFARSCKYGLGCLAAALRYRFAKGTLKS